MYIPKIFKEEDHDAILSFINSYPFAILVSSINNKIIASHLPLQIHNNDDKTTLIGHISKANQLKESIKDEVEVMVIFQGPHSYISSSWYTKQNVPTWNYIAVHAYGKLRRLRKEELIHSLDKLMDKYESHTQTYLKMTDLDERMLKRELRGIEGFEIQVDAFEASFKLSQNRDSTSFANIIEHLSASKDPNERAIAEAMKKNKKN